MISSFIKIKFIHMIINFFIINLFDGLYKNIKIKKFLKEITKYYKLIFII